MIRVYWTPLSQPVGSPLYGKGTIPNLLREHAPYWWVESGTILLS